MYIYIYVCVCDFVVGVVIINTAAAIVVDGGSDVALLIVTHCMWNRCYSW